MNWWRKLQLRLRALFQKRKLDAEMDEEMRSHIEMQTQENIEASWRHWRGSHFAWSMTLWPTNRMQRTPIDRVSVPYQMSAARGR